MNICLQVDMLVPGILGSRDECGKRYCGGRPQPIARGLYKWKGSSEQHPKTALHSKLLAVKLNNCLRVDMLVPGSLGSRDEFGKRYCRAEPKSIARGIYDLYINSKHLLTSDLLV